MDTSIDKETAVVIKHTLTKFMKGPLTAQWVAGTSNQGPFYLVADEHSFSLSFPVAQAEELLAAVTEIPGAEQVARTIADAHGM